MLDHTQIEFPVYPLSKCKKILRGSRGAVMIEDEIGNVHILDDTSIPGSFGRRRLVLKLQLEKAKELKLYKLRKSYFDWSEMLSSLRRVKTKTYVDSSGKIFTYQPKDRCKLTYHKIEKIQVVEGMATYLILEGIPAKLKVARPPIDEYKYAGILHSNIGLLFYNYATDKLRDTYRKL